MGPTTLGEFELIVLSDGTYLLDGGAFFGVVPKTLWTRKKDADELNRVRAGLNCLLVRSRSHTVLIETGIGDKLDERMRALNGVSRSHSLPDELRAHGVEPHGVDLVINTHLHFDHCGGNTRWNLEPATNALRVQRAIPVFPNARYVVQRGEWEHAQRRLERDRVSYLDENYAPLIESGTMTPLDGNCEVAPGIRVVVMPGHTRHMQVVLVQSGGKTCAFLSDLVPSTAHLTPTWIMAFDLFPLESIESKKQLLAQAAAERWLCVFVHDPDQPWGYVRAAEKGKYEFEPTE